MKKITAFFMALFPFLVIGVLFATGLISKNFADKTVQRLEMKQDLIEVQKPDDNELDYTVGKNVRVIPEAAKDPTVYWTSQDETIATVTDKETGALKINKLGYGDVKLTAVAKSNQSAKAECTVKVWDNKIHKIVVTNKEQAQFVSAGTQLLLQTKTIPAERLDNPKLKYEIKDASIADAFEITQTGLLTIGANANGGTCKVVVSSVANPEITETVDVSVGSSIDTIGFKDDGNTLIQEATYDLASQLVTAPYKMDINPETVKKYFKFYSSNEAMATIGKETGIIQFTDNYVPGTYVEFTAKFADLDSISCKKSVASSLNYYSSVSFNEGYSKTFDLDLSNPEECNLTDSGKISYTTYPSVGDTSRLHFESSNSDVIAVENNKFIAKSSGTATLTIKADVTQRSSISDKIDVTILSKNNQKILNQVELDIGNTNYYPLRSSLISTFKNKKISWLSSDSSVAEVDSTNETLFFKKNGYVNVTASYSDEATGISKTDTIKIICNNKVVKTIYTNSKDTQSIEVGQVFKVNKDSSSTASLELTSKPDSIIAMGDKTYMAKEGCGNTAFDLEANGTEFSLIVTQNVVDFTSTNDWTHYTTNAKEVSVATAFTIYPSTATYIETSWLGVKSPKTPSISYSYVAEDLSAVTIGEDNILKFDRPTTVAITATCKETTANYSLTSYAGGYGKFSLAKIATNKIYGSGLTLNLAPGAVESYYIDNFYLPDIGTKAEQAAAFKVKSLSGGKVANVTMYQHTSEDKLCFEFEGISNGTDTIEISNGSYTYYVYVTVSSAIVDANLYCLGNPLSKTNTINVYSKTNLLLNMDFSPVVARDDQLEFEFAGTTTYKWTQRPGQINLSQSGNIQWNDSADNTLTITRPAKTDPAIPAKVLAKYTFRVATTVPDITVLGIHDDNKYYLPSGMDYTVMEMYVEDAIFDQDYFKKNFTGWTGATIYGKYVVADAPAVGASQEVAITQKTDPSKSYKYTVARDSIWKITLPKNDSKSELDKKGLQRVHVYGTTSQYPDQTEPSDTYKLEVNLYGADTHLITDVTKKVEILKTLNKGFTSTIPGTSVEVNETTGNLDIKFSKTSNVYTWEEIFNNAFANEKTVKNQFFSISTNYGKWHDTADCYASYDFVVVDAVNVWDDKAIAKEATKAAESRKIVLQTNFGVEGEEATPFTLNDFRFEEVYGNGYILCFDSIAKQLIPNKGVHIQHASNIDLQGSKYETFPSLKDKCMHMDTSGGTREGVIDTVAYCKFSSFFQDMTIWSADGKSAFTHIKNTLFYNQQEYCRVALSISNPGNTTLVENCAFFNSSKISIMCNKNAVLQLKGDIDVYNFHGKDMFDSFGGGPELSEWCWRIVHPILESADLLQGEAYGSKAEEVTNAYLLTTLGGSVQFYDYTDASGKDHFITADHGSEKAANYLRYGAGIPNLCDLWTTVKPPLPLEFGHSPAYLDEFHYEGEERKLNYEVWNLLQIKVSRW